MTRKQFTFVFLLTLFLRPANAQDSNTPTAWDTSVAGVPSTMVVPNISTRVIAVSNASYVRVDQANFTNISNATVTVTLTDGSTNCNSGACNLLPSTAGALLTIAAGTTYTVSLNGQAAVGGVFWSASAANAVHGWVRGRR